MFHKWKGNSNNSSFVSVIGAESLAVIYGEYLCLFPIVHHLFFPHRLTS